MAMAVVVVMDMDVLRIMVVMFGHRPMVVLVPVVPEFGLVQQEKEDQASQQQGKQFVRARSALKGFGQQVHEGRGHQGTGRQAEHVLGEPRQHGKAQESGQPDAAHARGHGSDQYRNQGHVNQSNRPPLHGGHTKKGPHDATPLRC